MDEKKRCVTNLFGTIRAYLACVVEDIRVLLAPLGRGKRCSDAI